MDINKIIEQGEKEWVDGNYILFRAYSSYTGEGGDEIFSVEPDRFETGIILGDKVYGGNDFENYELTKENFKNGVYESGVDENGAHDVYEYFKAEIIQNISQQHKLLQSIVEMIDIYTKSENSWDEKAKGLFQKGALQSRTKMADFLKAKLTINIKE